MSARFPAEPAAYRQARNRLLGAEMELRRAIERVAAERRTLPLGGVVPEDYVFEGAGDTRVALSELFEPGKRTLVVYSFMYGPEMERACASCTSILDSLDGAAPHLAQRVSLAVVARSPLPRILDFAAERGWRHLRLVSSAGNGYNRDYLAEDEGGVQLPMLNVFVKAEDGTIRHSWGSELLYAPREPGEEPRHVDSIWPIWNVLDVTPEGRGADWGPQLSYGDGTAARTGPSTRST